MVCEKILGKLNSFDVAGKTVDYVDIDWDDAFKKSIGKPPPRGAKSASAWMTRYSSTA